MKYLTLFILSITFILFIGFHRDNYRLKFKPYTQLSEYGFFNGNLKDLNPVEGVYPYDLNTPLFSDYAKKARFFRIPAGKKIGYHELNNFDFPTGTVLIKNFYYPFDFRKPETGRRILETRLLVLDESEWKAFPYIWNKEQDEAYLEVAGGTLEVSWKDLKGKKKQINYSVPNINECKGCHNKNMEIKPIGPTARQMNRDYDFQEGKRNQLEYYEEKGIIDIPDHEFIPKASVWDDPSTGSLDQRARDYLDMNCAHCHNPEAPANTSGLFLNIHQNDPVAFGIMKSPIAAGRGSGGRSYDIVPGKPDESILLYRMESSDPGVQMPEIGRSMIHKEGIVLVREWIKSLEEE